MPNARPNVIPIICEWFQSRETGEIKSVLDIGCGFGKWGFLARLYLQAWTLIDLVSKEVYQDWRNTLRVDAIEIFEDYITDLQRLIYNNIYIGDMRKVIDEVENYDLIIMCDVLEHVTFEDGLKVLQTARVKAKWVIVSMPNYFIEGKSHLGNEAELHKHIWKDNEFPDNPEIIYAGNQKVIIYKNEK